MRDMESDKQSGKITLAVKLGVNKVKIYHYALIILAIVLSSLFAILYFTSIFNFIFVAAFIPLILHLKKVKKTTNLKLLDPELKKLALATFLLAVLMGVGHLL